MEAIIDLIKNYGIGVACIVYFMIRDFRFMDTMNQTLTSLNESTNLIKKYFLEHHDDGK